MDNLWNELEALCEELDRQLQLKLRSEMEGIVSEYLPQVWVFETELCTCTVFISSDGGSRVWSGAEGERDLTLRWRHDAFVEVLKARNRSSIEPGDYPQVFIQTAKGRAAFNYFQKEFGL